MSPDAPRPDPNPPDEPPDDSAPLDGVPAPEDQEAVGPSPADGPPLDSLAGGDTGWRPLAVPGKPDGEVDTRS